MPTKNYIGRFAPSPTGPLHFGSLVTAVASYFQAKNNNGVWLVRIEDIDKDREQIGASELILKTLEAFQLYWDEDVTYQSSRIEYYKHSIEQLYKLNKLYRCQCSRKTIREFNNKKNFQDNNLVYPGTCRNKNHPEEQPHSIRLLVENQSINFIDTIQGYKKENLTQSGDFVIKRADGSISYQLAVAVDDALQNITEVVRGVDLIDSCAKQILILKLLNYTIPQYSHLPILCHQDGSKLSKQTGAQPIDNNHVPELLWKVLMYLNQNPPSELSTNTTVKELHSWTRENWNISKITNTHNHLIYK